MTDNTDKPNQLVLTNDSATGRITVDMEAFFDFSFWLAEELEDTHELFKDFVKENRPQLDIEAIATGEVWFGQRALEKNLVDELKTSDEYLVDACKEADVYLISYEFKKTLQERFSVGMHNTVDRLILTWWSRLQNTRFYS